MFKEILRKILGSKPLGKQATILVVDDSDVDRTFSLRTLSNRGYKILSAPNGETGVQMAKAHRPDLILLDYMMPDLNGPEVCHILKNDTTTKNIPVIFLTSLDTPKSVVDCFEQGAEIFLPKPIKASELLEQVRLTLSEKFHA